MCDTLLTNGTISVSDFDYITLTDNIDEIVTIMVEHRAWKNKMRARSLDIDHDGVISVERAMPAIDGKEK